MSDCFWFGYMPTNKPWLDPTLLGEAKIMVENDLDKSLPQNIILVDKKGSTTINHDHVAYSWIPRKCGNCIWDTKNQVVYKNLLKRIFLYQS